MQNPAQESAMTEVALALAMGFFSLMILTLISMGVEANGADDTKAENPKGLNLVSSLSSASAIEPNNTDIVLFFDGSVFRNADLTLADPTSIMESAEYSNQRIILAVDPSLSFQAAMAAREHFPVPNLVVSLYSEDWKKSLSRVQGGQNAQK